MAKIITADLLVDGQHQKITFPEKTLEVVVRVTNDEGKEAMTIRINCDGTYTTLLANNIPYFPANAPEVGMCVGIWNEEMNRFDQQSNARLYPVEKYKIMAQNMNPGRKVGREIVIVGKPWVCGRD